MSTLTQQATGADSHFIPKVHNKLGGGTFRRRRFGAGQLGAVPFRRRYIFYLYFLSYEEKTMKQAIS